MKLIVIATASAVVLSGCTSSIGPDKYQHAAAGAVVAATGKALGMSNRQACGASILAGIAKEAYDSRHPDTHQVELMDAVATAAVCLPLLIADRQTYKGPPVKAVPKKPKSRLIRSF